MICSYVLPTFRSTVYLWPKCHEDPPSYPANKQTKRDVRKSKTHAKSGGGNNAHGVKIYNKIINWQILPSVLWRCCLGVRKSIRPVKKLSDGVLAWLSVWNVIHMICIWSSRCHCHLIIACFSKIQNGLPFWYRLTQVVLEKKAVKRTYVCVCN